MLVSFLSRLQQTTRYYTTKTLPQGLAFPKALGYNQGMDDETTKIYDAVGGDQPFYDLVDAFYQGVEAEPILRPLYPDDLTHSKEHMSLFLIQRFGGHTAYGDRRGHPRLRMRHVPFRIGPSERDAWLHCMFAAIAATPALTQFRDSLRRYFTESANFLVNTDTVPAVSS